MVKLWTPHTKISNWHFLKIDFPDKQRHSTKISKLIMSKGHTTK